MLVSLTVGKVDAGVAVLLTEDKRLIEFPSILLPPDISSGSIVDITVSRNFKSEDTSTNAFNNLQNTIFQTFGQRSPSAPVLRCRNATQTSLVLEWDPIELATASMRSLSLYRNGSKAGSIPRPTEQHATKISGLAVDTEYTFHLVLRTSAGTYGSEKLTVRTHKMTELHGITVTPGIMPAPLRESLEKTVEAIGGKIADTVRIDTTHFVCTEGRGQAWERAVEMNVPVVVPDWVKGCEREGRIVGVRQYYINADPRMRQVGPSVAQQKAAQEQQQQQQQQQQQKVETPRTEIIPPTPEKVPPTPPPKPDHPPSPEPQEPKSAREEPKARVEDVKPASASPAAKVEDEESDEEEQTEASNEKAFEAGLPVRQKSPNKGEKSDDDESGSFQEVAL